MTWTVHSQHAPAHGKVCTQVRPPIGECGKRAVNENKRIAASLGKEVQRPLRPEVDVYMLRARTVSHCAATTASVSGFRTMCAMLFRG